MLFGRSNSSTSHKKPTYEPPLISQPRPSQDLRVSFSDSVRQRPDDLAPRQRHDEWRFCALRRCATPDSPTASINPSLKTHFHNGPQSTYATRFSHEMGRASIGSWVSSQHSDCTAETVVQQIRDGSGEFRTVKGESLSLFPRAEKSRTLFSSGSTPRPSTDLESVSSTTSSAKRAVPDRLTQGFRMSRKKLKHSASKLSLVSSIDESDEIPKFKSMRSPCSVHVTHRCKCETEMNYSISGPLNFRHVTHALPQQFKNMEKRNQSDLVADFSAMRASQIPRLALHGIKAQDLEHCRSSLDNLITPPRSAVPSLASSSSLDSLQSARLSSQANSMTTRRSKESFSRPFFDGRPPRVDSMYPSRSPSTSSRTSSIALHERSWREADVLCKDILQPVEEIHALSPLDELAWELNLWTSPSFEPELPSVKEAEILTITPVEAAMYQVKSHYIPHNTGHRSAMFQSTIVVASDRDPDFHGDDSSALDSPGYDVSSELRASMLRSSITNGMCTSWKIEED